MVSVTRIAPHAVTLTTSGVSVTIPTGSNAAVGPYQITVTSIDSGTATFKVIPPS